MTTLRVEQLVAGYEPGAPIVRGASLALAPGEILALIGPNGAGKSTLLKAIAGLVPASAGSVRLDGRDITVLPTHRMVRAGLGFVPQTGNVFANLTVAENLDLAAALAGADRRAARVAMAALFPDLDRLARLPAGRLSGGQRQMVAIARALVAGPRVLLLDEPSAGLSPLMVGVVLDRLAAIRAQGVAILLVEQNVAAAFRVADRVIVLAEGRERLEGSPAALRGDPRLGDLFLGRSEVEGVDAAIAG